MATCTSCGRSIFWGKTEASNRRMPVDMHPVDDGNVLIVSREEERTPLLRVLKRGEEPPPEVSRYVSHFVTCPEAEQHRKKKGTDLGRSGGKAT